MIKLLNHILTNIIALANTSKISDRSSEDLEKLVFYLVLLNVVMTQLLTKEDIGDEANSMTLTKKMESLIDSEETMSDTKKILSELPAQNAKQISKTLTYMGVFAGTLHFKYTSYEAMSLYNGAFELALNAIREYSHEMTEEVVNSLYPSLEEEDIGVEQINPILNTMTKNVYDWRSLVRELAVAFDKNSQEGAELLDQKVVGIFKNRQVTSAFDENSQEGADLLDQNVVGIFKNRQVTSPSSKSYRNTGTLLGSIAGAIGGATYGYYFLFAALVAVGLSNPISIAICVGVGLLWGLASALIGRGICHIFSSKPSVNFQKTAKVKTSYSDFQNHGFKYTLNQETKDQEKRKEEEHVEDTFNHITNSLDDVTKKMEQELENNTGTNTTPKLNSSSDSEKD